MQKKLIILSILALTLIGGIWYFMGSPRKGSQSTPEESAPVKVPPTPEATIDYNKLDQDKDLQQMMAQRKSQHGVDQGLDLIVKKDEAVTIGDTTVKMQDVAEQINLQKGKIVEKNISEEASGGPSSTETYGIYVVQPNDNVWNIHFRFLKSYFAQRNIELSPKADEPNSRGYSSGVGKLLKFSENMVHIYNIKEKKLVRSLDTIEPQSKIVIYSMKDVFALLDTIDQNDVHRIRFDGDAIWIPGD